MRFATGLPDTRWSLISILVLACGGPGEPDTGTLNVIVTTTGSPVDPDGYLLSLNSAPPEAIALGGERAFEGLPGGEYTVTLSGLAQNCAVSGENPVVVTLAAGGAASATFAVECVPLAGTVRIATSSEGAPLDSDGYLVQVDTGTAQPIPANGLLEIPDVPVGDHAIRLDGVWAYCGFEGSEAGIATQPATVTFGSTVEVQFTVQCQPALRNRIIFAALRTGAMQIYAIRPDGTGDTRISQDPSTITGVFLDASLDGTKLVHVTGGPVEQHLEVLSSLGAEMGEVVTGIPCPTTPAWSPDGQRLAFGQCGNGPVRVIDVDGTDEIVLADGEVGMLPAWTPDGGRIVFSRTSDTPGSLAIVDADGSDLVPLTATPDEQVIDPAVSPDGSMVVFARGVGPTRATTDLYIINIDGTGERLLRHADAYQSHPSWSPDGTRIVFQQDLPSGLFSIDAAGGMASPLVLNPSSIAWPIWTR